MSIRFESSFVVEASVLLDEDEMKLILLAGSIHILRNRAGGKMGSEVTMFAHLQHYISACSILIFRKSLLFTLSSDNLHRKYCCVKYLQKLSDKIVNKRDFLKIIDLYKHGGE